WPFDPFQHEAKGRLPYFVTRLMDSCERHRQQAGIVHIVDTDQTNIFRDTRALRQQSVHQMTRDPIVGAHEGIAILCRRWHVKTAIRRTVDDTNIVLASGMCGQSLFVPGNTSFNRGCLMLICEEPDPARTKL